MKEQDETKAEFVRLMRAGLRGRGRVAVIRRDGEDIAYSRKALAKIINELENVGEDASAYRAGLVAIIAEIGEY